ncbi:acetyl-CoA synthetase-like protein [Favolaschia claudopus]|uniref:Acetyl-CoA synthetase-like protein n=1 Tax=Favolaschia claudopus TaxID=2862362 RepID=A0AAV9Z030_9AGAR
MATTHPPFLPLAPQTQARSSNTFTPAALDGSLNIAQIYDWHFEKSANHRLFVYAAPDGSVKTVFWPKAVQAIWSGAKILRDRFNWAAGQAQEMHVVGILAPSDNISYFTLLVSCLRANYIPFAISPRNSPAAIAHLIEKTAVQHLLIGHEPSMLELVNTSLDILRDRSPTCRLPDVSYVPLFEQLFLPEDQRISTPNDIPYEYSGPDHTALIMHSSGSTAFPKPISWSNRRVLQTALVPWFGDRDLTNKILSLHAIPMYHGMGIVQTMWAASCGLVLATCPPTPIPPVPTPHSLIEGAKATNSDIIFCVPSFIETWSKEEETVRWLASRTGLLFGGGPLNKEAGDYMASQGVGMFVMYGLTESGVANLILPADADEWEYFKLSNMIVHEMLPYGNNTFELVLLPSEFNTPAVLNTQVHGMNAYATSDLLVPHPTKRGYWKIFGRTDDQIMHSTGEKAKTMLTQDPHVQSAVMFGRGRFQAGILVEPNASFKFDPADEVKLAEYRNLIWPTVVRMNEYAPQHSRLFKEMILVEKPDKPFTYTAKSTVRRQAVIAHYESEIDALYNTVDSSANLNLPPLSAWNAESVLNFVRDAVNSLLVTPVGDEDDIFQHGCDSLQATWLRNAFLRVLREHGNVETRRETRNFVYDYPTISALGAYVFKTGSDSSQTQTVDSVEARTKAMYSMAEKYVRSLPPNLPVLSSEAEPYDQQHKVVLLTGTTGGLGCNLLAHLLADSRVDFVFAVNRAASGKVDSGSRQRKALEERGFDSSIVSSPKLSLCEGDLSKPLFGLNERQYQQMFARVTHIIHSAWPVHFSIGLSSFEPNILGLRNLIEFSLTSPFAQARTLLFTSSIGILLDFPGEVPPQGHLEAAVDPGMADTGYKQSKWVGEHMLCEAQRLFGGAKLIIVRVGQLAGGINGAWNAHEWFPGIVQSANYVNCLPDDHRARSILRLIYLVVSWIPVHIAAGALADFIEDPSIQFMHLVNPKVVSWRSLANVFASELKVPLVSYAEWLSRLDAVVSKSSHPDTFRAPHLLEIFHMEQHAGDETREAFGFPRFDTANALRASPFLREETYQLTASDVRPWIQYWRSVGLF